VPLPSQVVVDPEQRFLVTADTRVRVPAGDPAAAALGRLLGRLAAVAPYAPLEVSDADRVPASGHFSLELDLGADAALGDEGYALSVTSGRVTLVARSHAGLFYGIQTIRQLLPVVVEHEAARRGVDPIALPAVDIRDAPRYAWRGAMLDVARHFFDVAAVKRFIDLLALHKINRLHLHLSDDQGWRIEIQSWPRLATHGGSTEVGGGPGGYYTQAEYADLVAYAAERYITVVPEIDMPGHTNAALASYAELNCDGVAPPLYTGTDVGFSALCPESPATWRFVEDLVRELVALTPGDFLHVGGDEVEKLGDAAYSRFIERVQGIVERNGKRMIGWDEAAAAGLSPSSVVQLWRPDAPVDLLARAPALILSPANRTYLDMKYGPSTLLGLEWAGHIEVDDAYGWEPSVLVPARPGQVVLGVEAPLWTETVATLDEAESMVFPRLAALAEVAWTPATRRHWPGFARRLAAQAPRWQALGVNFHPSPRVPWDR
jgi:hexosaminidase